MPIGLVDAVDAVLAVERRLDEDQRAAGHLAREDRDRVVVLGGDIDVLAVGAHRDRAGSVQSVDAVDAVLEALHQGELAEVVARQLDVAIEDQQGVRGVPGDVEMAAAGGVGGVVAGGDPHRPVEAGNAVDDLDLGDAPEVGDVAAVGVAREDGDRRRPPRR